MKTQLSGEFLSSRFVGETERYYRQPDIIASWFTTASLGEVLKLQTLLAQQGICLTLSTAEIQYLEPQEKV